MARTRSDGLTCDTRLLKHRLCSVMTIDMQELVESMNVELSGSSGSERKTLRHGP